jgi:hypothetical protein
MTAQAANPFAFANFIIAIVPLGEGRRGVRLAAVSMRR